MTNKTTRAIFCCLLTITFFLFPQSSLADAKSDLGAQLDKDIVMSDKLTADMTNSAYTIDQFKTIFQKCTADFTASSGIYSNMEADLEGAYKTTATKSATIFSDIAAQCTNSVASIDNNDETTAQKANDQIYTDLDNFNVAIDEYNQAYNAEVDATNKQTDDYNVNLEGYSLLVIPLFAAAGIFILLDIIFLLLMLFSKTPESKNRKKNILLASLFATLGFGTSWIWYANLSLDQSYYYSLIPAAIGTIYFIISIVLSFKKSTANSVGPIAIQNDSIPQQPILQTQPINQSPKQSQPVPNIDNLPATDATVPIDQSQPLQSPSPAVPQQSAQQPPSAEPIVAPNETNSEIPTPPAKP